MSLECGECERDLRGPHNKDCSRYREEFICERCGEECDDTSYQPLCPDCYHDTHQDEQEASNG